MTTVLKPAEVANPNRVLHTMWRVADLERSLHFYSHQLGMTLFRREDYPSGKFTLAFVGYGTEDDGAVIELTHNWCKAGYEHGSAFGHMALAVTDIDATCARLQAAGVKLLRAPGPMSTLSPQRQHAEVIAFVEDPDGFRIELIQV
jgi:lactoylglutathione lyase